MTVRQRHPFLRKRAARWAERHPRWVSGALVVSALALVATSAPNEYFYAFEQTHAGSTVELTAEAPTARFRVSARAQGLAPNRKPTTDEATAILRGTVGSDGVEAGSTFVEVRLSAVETGPPLSELSALTQFELGAELSFDGDCSKLSNERPCETELYAELRRQDAGSGGGTIRVDWELAFRSSVSKGEDGPSENLGLPWAIEVAPE